MVTSVNRRPPAWLTGAFVFATISGTVRHRRQLTISRAASRATADEVHKSIELETRVARVELEIRDIHAAPNVLTQRNIALQAHLDHLSARVSSR